MLQLFRFWPLCFQNSIDTDLSLSCAFYVVWKNRDLKCITLWELLLASLAELYSQIAWLLCIYVATHIDMENYHFIPPCVCFWEAHSCAYHSLLFLRKKSPLRLRILQTILNCCSLPLLLSKDCWWTCPCKGPDLNLLPVFSGSRKQPFSLYLSSNTVHHRQLFLSMLRWTRKRK